MRVEILDSAHEDMANGYAFYEHQAAGLGAYFSDTLYSEMESLQLYAGIHPVRFGFYRLLAHRFPYSVYYKVANGIVKVYAVMDNRMNPDRISHHLASL